MNDAITRQSQLTETDYADLCDELSRMCVVELRDDDLPDEVTFHGMTIRPTKKGV